MQRHTKSVIAAGMLFILAGCASEADRDEAPAVERTFFSGARLIPGDGSPPIEGATFIVENGRFQEIGERDELQAPRGAGRVDLEGQTVIPVLVNLHGHVGMNDGASLSPRNYTRESILADLNRYAYYGVFAVLSLGGDAGDIAFEIKAEQAEGSTPGALLFTAGRGITVPDGWPTELLGDIPFQAGTEAEARRAVVELADDGVDFVKIWVDDNMGSVPKMRPEIYRAVIEEAQQHDLPVVAHVFYLADAKELVRAGVSGLVHSVRDREVDDELITMMREGDVFYVPTLTAHQNGFVYADEPEWLGEQAMREVYPAQVSAYYADQVIVNRYKRNPATARLRQYYNVAVSNLKKVADAGIRIGMGTDSGGNATFPGYFEHRELELMAEAGMSPMDVITAATSTSASILGLNDNGTLAVGKNADFIVLSDNPLDGIASSREIVSVYKNGAEMDRLALIQNLPFELPRITDRERQEDAATTARERAEAALERFGRFPLGPAANVRALAVPTPRGSRSTVNAGPPDSITVTLNASANDLLEFYRRALPRYNWEPQGGCWQRSHPISGRTEMLCVEASPNTAVLQITEQ